MFNYLYGIFGRQRNILSRASLPIAGIRQHRCCSTFRDRQSRWRLEQSVWRARCFQFPGVCVIYVLEESGKENKKRNRLKRDAGVKNCSFDKCDESLCCVRGKMSSDSIQYSEKYNDDKYEYRHVILSAELTKLVPKSHLMTETEWRNLTVQQSPGWVHYMMHGPEPHVLLFRRLRSNPPQAMNRNGPVLVEAQN